MTQTSTPLSLRAYAKLRGVSAQAVSRAVDARRLQRSVVRVRGVPKIADPDLADREWAANTDLSRAPDYVKARAARDARPSAGPFARAEDLVITPNTGVDGGFFLGVIEGGIWGDDDGVYDEFEDSGWLVLVDRKTAVAFARAILGTVDEG